MSTRQILFLATLILLVAFGLRLHRLALDSVWWDEGFSVWMARLPLAEMFNATAHDAHPPLYYMILHGWRACVGDEEFALRMLSVLCGVLIVTFAFRLGAEVGEARAALAAAALVATARLQVGWSQEIRMYAPAALWATIALWAAARLLTRRTSAWWMVAVLALSNAAGLLTFYLYVGVLLVQNLAFLYSFVISRWRWDLLRRWVIAQVGGALVFLPWLLYALPRLPSWASPQMPVTFRFVAELYLSTVLLGITSGIERYALLLGLGLVMIVGTSILSLRQTTRLRASVWVLLVISTLLPVALVYLLSLPRGHFNYPTPSPRYFLLLSTPTYVLLSWGLSGPFRQRWVGALPMLGLVALFCLSLTQHYPGLRLRDDYISMATTLDALRRPNDAVLLNTDQDWPVFAYHYTGPFDRVYHSEPIQDDKYAMGLLEPYEYIAEGVWLVQTPYAEASDPNNYLGEWLQRHAWNTRRYSFSEGQLWFFALTPERGDPNTIDQAFDAQADTRPVSVAIAEDVELIGAVIPLSELDAGQWLTVGLAWRINQDGLSGEWPVALRLLGEDGSVYASGLTVLAGIGSADFYTPAGLFVPPDTPTGWYDLVFVAGENSEELGRLWVREALSSAVAAEVPPDATSLNYRFGDSIVLVGVSLPEQTEFAPGEQIPLVLYWQATGPTQERYKVFVHLVGEAYNTETRNNVWGQQDQEPRGGAAVTTSWRQDQIIADDYLIPISPDAPPGTYRIEAGLYLPLGWQRLPVVAGDGDSLGDHVVLGEVEVVP